MSKSRIVYLQEEECSADDGVPRSGGAPARQPRFPASAGPRPAWDEVSGDSADDGSASDDDKVDEGKLQELGQTVGRLKLKQNAAEEVGDLTVHEDDDDAIAPVRRLFEEDDPAALLNDDGDAADETPMTAARIEDAQQLACNTVIIRIKPENRITSEIMTLAEMTEHTSIRATQIARDNNYMVRDDDVQLDDPTAMAKRELMKRRSPLLIRRKIGELYDKATNTLYQYTEYWNPNQMAFKVNYE